MHSILTRIISGGQTGTDQAALQAAIDTGLDHGGWCPPGRQCETGEIPSCFTLIETPLERDSSAPDVPRSQRTIRNIRDSDAALIFLSDNEIDRGTELAVKTAKELNKPALIVDPDDMKAFENIVEWLDTIPVRSLSVGGPAESSHPGVYERVYEVLMRVFSAFGDTDSAKKQ